MVEVPPQPSGVEALADGVGHGGTGGLRPLGQAVRETGPEALDRVPHQHQQLGLRRRRRQQWRHPREGEIVGRPLAGDGAGPAGKPGGVGGDLGRAEGAVGHVREVVALLVQVGACPHARVVGDELVPPAGPALLHADADEVGRAGRLGGVERAAASSRSRPPRVRRCPDGGERRCAIAGRVSGTRPGPAGAGASE